MSCIKIVAAQSKKSSKNILDSDELTRKFKRFGLGAINIREEADAVECGNVYSLIEQLILNAYSVNGNNPVHRVELYAKRVPFKSLSDDVKNALPNDSSDFDFVEISVSDNGPGIPEGILPRIFEEGFTTRPDGTGFGLAYVARGVAAVGGTCKVQSVVGQGATFILYLRIPKS